MPTYWIINLGEAQIEAYSQPTGPCDLPCYRQAAVYGRGPQAPRALAGEEAFELLVDDLLP